MIQQANELKPDNGAYLDSLGWFHYLKGDFDAAIKHLSRAEELMEDEPDSVIFEHLARAYFSSGDKDKARRYIDRALELEPEKETLKAFRKSIDGTGETAAEKAEPAP
jgi:tetratricopeptide (TPR) repeat protein